MHSMSDSDGMVRGVNVVHILPSEGYDVLTEQYMEKLRIFNTNSL